MVTVVLERAGGLDTVRVTGNGPAASSGDQPCQVHVTVMPALDEIELGLLPDTDQRLIPVRVMCGTALLDQYWAIVAETRDYDAIARAEAQRHVEHHLAPAMAIAHSPPANALVGLPTWTWMTGWDGRPITIGPIAPFDRSITIELTHTHTTWDFGDPHDPTTHTAPTLGAADTDTVAHTYTHHGPHTITASTTIAVTYTLDGGPTHTVDPLATTHTRPITLHQLQAVLTND